MSSKPPFEITAGVLARVSRIERLLGRAETSAAVRLPPQLRRENRIRTVKDSLAIEGNRLSQEQVTAIFDNKRVIGPPKEILEVKNAIRAYHMADAWRPWSERDFLHAHKVFMRGLLKRLGAYRTGAVGVLKKGKVSHVAPPAARLPGLMGNLFEFIKRERNGLSPLVLSAVVHYEIEFIHPFEDGNGRMGRLWQHVILRDYHPAFETLPVESLIKERQAQYYRVLERCDKAGSSSEFVRFSLKTLEEALLQMLSAAPKRRMLPGERLEFAKASFGSRVFTRKEYANLFPGISLPSASRDLAGAVAGGRALRTGRLNQAVYRFNRKD